MTSQDEFSRRSAATRATPEYKKAYAEEQARYDSQRGDAQNVAEAVFRGVAQRCWQTAEDSGWHGDETFGDKIALMHSELSEALEEYRNDQDLDLIYYSYKDANGVFTIDYSPTHPDENGDPVLNKVEGVASELADVIIRIFDDSIRFGIPVVDALFQKMLYNKTREYRHGGKKI